MIYVVGPIAFDTQIYCQCFPVKGAAVPVTGLYQVFGGGGGNVSAVLAKFGVNVSLISMVGEDFAGSDYEKFLHSELIDVRHVKTVKGTYTSRASMPVDAHGHLESFFYWGATAAFRNLLVPRLKLGPKDIIHIATGDPKFNKRLAEAYQSATISFDPGYDVPLYSKEDLEFILKRASFFFANEHEAAVVLKKLGKKTGKELLAYGLKAAIITHGPKGSVLYARKETVKVKAYAKARAVDPTGAGDSHRGGFLAAFAKGKSLKECAKVASATASFVIEEFGAQTGIPSWEQALERAKGL